ncbi:hypothetical protein SAMN05443247_06907 [Bradyrhizobium erythrophlei]|nr:hypothetical protein SAMN05443247_06907 [Bradyrhizobium erythrophlei]
MQRYAIIDTATDHVINVVEYESSPSSPPPGFDQGIIAVQSDLADMSWTWNGTSLVAPAPLPVSPLPQSVLPQDLMAQFTADDAAKIQMAVSANVPFWLLWSALQTQKDPMLVTNARFLAGWAALTQVLGAPRMTAIAAALGVTVTLP